MMTLLFRLLLCGMLIILTGHTMLAQKASKPPAKTPALTGTWEAVDGDAVVRLVFKSATELELEGEAFSYVLTPKVIRLNEDGQQVDYPYVLKGDLLVLTLEEGDRLSFRRVSANSATANRPASPGPSETPASGHEHLLVGRFMSYSSASSSTGSSSWTTYVTFDGRGGFAWNSESAHSANQYDQTGTQTGAGLAYGADSGNRGTYRVEGDRILVRFADGSEGEARVKERFGDGSIGAFTYDGRTYAR
jgi:hypothetical protein